MSRGELDKLEWDSGRKSLGFALRNWLDASRRHRPAHQTHTHRTALQRSAWHRVAFTSPSSTHNSWIEFPTLTRAGGTLRSAFLFVLRSNPGASQNSYPFIPRAELQLGAASAITQSVGSRVSSQAPTPPPPLAVQIVVAYGVSVRGFAKPSPRQTGQPPIAKFCPT